jgi:Domain of Unknown Function with PDB structure (DUF3857)/Transglutaminase-like superfamily
MSKQFSRVRPSNFAIALGFLLLLCGLPVAHAGDSAPDWLRQLTKVTLPKYPDEADAVVLLDDETLNVRDNGDMYTTYRRAVKILRPGGKEYGAFYAYFDKDTKIESMKAWCITDKGQEFQLKEKDAVETSPWSDAMYEDARLKALKVPASEVGSYVAVEYTQRHRPYAFSENWSFQEHVPVKTARLTLNLPSGWEYQYHFANWAEKKPANSGGNSWTWQIEDIPGIEHEQQMPAAASLEGRMVVSFFSATLQASRMDSWSDVARWADALNAGRRIPTPQMQAKVAELARGGATPEEKMRALASYVQRSVRYVEISIGIGGYQSHMAGDTFAHSYGDCKDKATLLITMLHEAGIEAYLTLVHHRRGVVNPATPSPFTFDHAIVAIKVPEGVDTASLYAIVDDPKLGKILFFDPTNDKVPFGMIPGYEQTSYALVVANNGGELVQMPKLAPALNRLMRVAHLQLAPDGSLSGEVEELRSGEEAANMRAHLESIDKDKRVKYFEALLSSFLDRSKLTYASISGLDKHDEPLILRYKFEAANYAKSAGDLMLLRPRVLGENASGIAEDKKRRYAVSYERTKLQSDLVDIKLPPGYKVDELPGPTEVTAPFAEYKSKIEAKDDKIYYNRMYTVKDLQVPLEDMGALRTFMRGVAADERNAAVLKKEP